MWLTFALRYWKPIAALALAVLLLSWAYGAGYSRANDRCKVESAKAMAHLAKQIQAKQAEARDAEARAAKAQQAIGAAYEQGKRDAQRKADAVVAGLRAGSERLRDEWRVCEASEAAATAGLADARARLREEGAGNLIGAGAEADAWIKGLQDVIRQYEQQSEGWSKR